jgi:hypothetical protein
MVVPCLADRWFVGRVTRALFACPVSASAHLSRPHLRRTPGERTDAVLHGATLAGAPAGMNLSRGIANVAAPVGRGPLLAAR